MVTDLENNFIEDVFVIGFKRHPVSGSCQGIPYSPDRYYFKKANRIYSEYVLGNKLGNKLARNYISTRLINYNISKK